MKGKMIFAVCVLLAGFLSFFDTVACAFVFSYAALTEFCMLAVLSFVFFVKQSSLKSVTLTKKDIFISVLFGCCLTLGYGLLRARGFDIFYGSALSVAVTAVSFVYYCIFSVCLLKYLYASFEAWLNKADEQNTHSKFRFISYIYEKISRNSLKFYFAVFSLSWLPSFIIHFPGMLMYDSVIQMMMYYGIPNNHTNASILINPENFITMHHGVIHTVAVGKFSDIGVFLFGKADFGIFLYTVLQYIVVTFAVSYLFKSIKGYLGVKWTAVFMVLFALHPFFGTCAVLMTKDIYFCSFFILYILKYYELVRVPEKIKSFKFFFEFFFVTVLLLLFRNNAFYTVVLVSIVMLVFLKPKKQILAYIALLIAFNTGYNNILMPALEVSPGSVREMLSVPFQQTAYYVNKYENEVTPEEKQAISKILDYDVILSSYETDRSDAVKDTFNKYAATEDLKNYFIVWFKMFLKHPWSYVEAFLHLNYGYYFPSVKDSVTYDCLNDYGARVKGIQYGLPLEQPQKPGFFKMAFYRVYMFLAGAPFLCLFTDTGIFMWLWIFTGLFVINKFARDKKKYLLYLVPYFAYIVFILVGPVNGTIYFRYVMPFVYTLPLMFMPFFEYKQDTKQ